MKETRIYKQIKDCTISADVYDHGSGTPVIVYIHGGALMMGTRSWLPAQQVEYYQQRGFSVISIDYRLAPETKLDLIVEDIRDAMDWIRTKANQWYDFDTANLALVGSSAGGYLSLLTGTLDVKPKAIVSFYGYGDILGDWYAEPSEFYCQKPMISRRAAAEYVGDRPITEGPQERFNYYLYCRQNGVWVEEVTGLDPTKDIDKLRKYNPIGKITKEYPPTLLIHGDRDTDVPYEQSAIMHKKLQETGVDSEFITIKDGEHGFDHDFHDPQVQFALERVIRFLQIHLKFDG